VGSKSPHASEVGRSPRTRITPKKIANTPCDYGVALCIDRHRAGDIGRTVVEVRECQTVIPIAYVDRTIRLEARERVVGSDRPPTTSFPFGC
jgi:hypothetical protein